MKLSVYNAIAAILGADETLSECEKGKIPDLCRAPDSFADTHSSDIPTLLTLKETTDMLKVHPTTIRRMVKAGKLRRLEFARHPRFLLEDVERLVPRLPTQDSK